MSSSLGTGSVIKPFRIHLLGMLSVYWRAILTHVVFLYQPLNHLLIGEL